MIKNMFRIKLLVSCIPRFRFAGLRCGYRYRFKCRFSFEFGFAFGFGFRFALRFRFGLKKWYLITIKLSFGFILDYSEIRLKWTFEVLTLHQYQTMNCNAIWETCGTKLMPACINEKLCDVSTFGVY